MHAMRALRFRHESRRAIVSFQVLPGATLVAPARQKIDRLVTCACACALGWVLRRGVRRAVGGAQRE